MNKDKLEEFQKFAEKIAIQAGNILLTFKNNYIVKVTKDSLLDIATDADLASEKFIISEIKKNYPDHSIFTEEHQEQHRINSDFEWIIDPLDGTKEFIRNIPLYGINISLEYKKKLILGVVYQPELKRLYSSSIFSNSRLNNMALHVSREENLIKSIIHLRLPNYRMNKKYFDRYMRIFPKIISSIYRIRSDNWDVESLCYVASGSLEGFVLSSTVDWSPPKWWDLSAGVIMVLQAGGTVTNFNGKLIINRDLTKGLIASNGKIHKKLLDLVQGFHS
ncbi:hypothetical protein COS50_03225 [Candidatus Roizmanbacteria bacterium CG03_land_8_20_14_0_80_35_26]|uniref:Inositol monophosphatase n=2 Tax=Candidatus Roizmaniibacteriota TaxID=1752723 RepID=A0A2M7BWC6_9BACT|nr:MAG: hypothetical protein COS50_03225 [Candidatus Roizmanbacteria bacterium CG03_land_8_20_14_0_80_35_26]PJC80772.1 MAG: hypothetical protein CO008_00980 [Candidatus Roizmanbacteria bacterium CG_4_8_14_3_um_filter_36_12]